MIIFRYLARELLSTLLAVSSVLLLIFVSGTFVRYLAEAAAGDLSPAALLSIMLYRMPGVLELVLPLGTFVGIMLAFGRLYVDSEMVVLSACGLSQRRLLGYTLLAVSPVLLLVAFLSLYLSPIGVQKVESTLAEQRARGEFDLLLPGQFQPLSGGQGAFYTEHISGDRERLGQVFIASASADTLVTGQAIATLRAERGRQAWLEDYQRRYLVLEAGRRYSGVPGQPDFHQLRFAEFGQQMQNSLRDAKAKWKVEAEPTAKLWRAEHPRLVAGLQWRLSLPILVLVVALLAVPLARTNPRQGRYLGMIPAILLYIVYLVALNAARDALGAGKLSPAIGVWPVHAGFLALALLLFNWGHLCRAWRHRSRVGGRARHA